MLLLLSCDRSSPVEIVDDGIPPGAPTGLNIFREHDGEIGIEWNHNLEKDLSYYKIFRSNSNSRNFMILDSTTSSYYLDIGLDYDTTYYYKISAVDIYGYESQLSDSVLGTPKNLYLPLPPYYLNINARNWNDSLSVKITFGKSFSTDVKYYEVHRSVVSNFSPDSLTFTGIAQEFSFIDKTDLELLQTYYYKIVSVDKGNLRSQPSVELNDILLDKPVQIKPLDNARVDYFSEFEIRTCSKPASYKIVLQSNEIYGTQVELNFISSEINSIISIPIKNITFNAYADYYWRIFTYTKNNNIPNSFSELYKFTIVPGG